MIFLRGAPFRALRARRASRSKRRLSGCSQRSGRRRPGKRADHDTVKPDQAGPSVFARPPPRSAPYRRNYLRHPDPVRATGKR